MRCSRTALQPQKYEAHDRNQDIAVKDDPGIAGSKIVLGDHLVNVHSSRAPQKAGWPDDRREAQAEAPFEGQETHDRKPETGEADFGLKWAVRPSDEARTSRRRTRA
jgi:hypothetical protein